MNRRRVNQHGFPPGNRQRLYPLKCGGQSRAPGRILRRSEVTGACLTWIDPVSVLLTYFCRRQQQSANSAAMIVGPKPAHVQSIFGARLPGLILRAIRFRKERAAPFLMIRDKPTSPDGVKVFPQVHINQSAFTTPTSAHITHHTITHHVPRQRCHGPTSCGVGRQLTIDWRTSETNLESLCNLGGSELASLSSLASAARLELTPCSVAGTSSAPTHLGASPGYRVRPKPNPSRPPSRRRSGSALHIHPPPNPAIRSSVTQPRIGCAPLFPVHLGALGSLHPPLGSIAKTNWQQDPFVCLRVHSSIRDSRPKFTRH